MLAEKVLAGKSQIEDYFPEYARYTMQNEGRLQITSYPPLFTFILLAGNNSSRRRSGVL